LEEKVELLIEFVYLDGCQSDGREDEELKRQKRYKEDSRAERTFLCLLEPK
jgi:hypothetical protein